MQLRVGDDAHRMRARGQRDQPDPVAGADQVVGREPARRRLAARAPGRDRRTSRRSRSGPAMRNQTALASWPFASREAELALEQAGAAAGVDEPAGFARVLLLADAPGDPVRPAALAERDVLDPARRRRRRCRGAAPPRRGSSRRCRGRSGSSAPRGSGSRRSRSPRRCRAGPPTKKKRKPNFFSWRSSRCCFRPSTWLK